MPRFVKHLLTASIHSTSLQLPVYHVSAIVLRTARSEHSPNHALPVINQILCLVTFSISQSICVACPLAAFGGLMRPWRGLFTAGAHNPLCGTHGSFSQDSHMTMYLCCCLFHFFRRMSQLSSPRPLSLALQRPARRQTMSSFSSHRD